ncbi:EVE domain-containing protein [Gordonia asplenii]|nr:EVE domain-containing protein [Gordonia asplenii]
MTNSTHQNYWLGVVSASHVRRGIDLGIAQVNHGKRAGLARMARGDGLVYYSPRTDYPDGDPLRAFTAVGIVADDDIWQADEGSFKPYRRRVNYLDAEAVPLAELHTRLVLTTAPNWGYQLRRGLISLSENDFRLIQTTMTAALT